jgi:nitroreductase
MNDVLKCLMERRSIRKYNTQQVSDELLEQILLAASFSPNAGNRQTTQIVICQNSEINEKLGKINKSFFNGHTSQIGNFVSEKEPSIADDPEIVSAFYGAPTVVTLFGLQKFRYTEADCWIMASDIALAARSLGVGSCILGRAEETFETDFGKQTQASWGIREGYEAKVHILLGYPARGWPDAKDRTYPDPVVIR